MKITTGKTNAFATRTRSPRGREKRHRRPVVEHLESRTLLATFYPATGVPGTFSSGADSGELGPVAQIVDGNTAPFYAHVGLLASAPNSGGFCSGTLITRQHVLTAGHCIDGNGDGMLDANYFRTGLNANVFDGGKAYRVIEAFRHPQYSIQQIPHPSDPSKRALKSIRNDIAILRLETLVLDGVPAQRFTTSPPVPFVGEIVGFGRTGSVSTGLLQDNGTTRYHGYVVVDGLGSRDGVGSPTNTLTFAIDQQRESNTAGGDSGGPTFVLQSGQPPRIIGVHSYGDERAARRGARSYDERVDVHNAWIDSILARDSSGPAVQVDWANDITQPGSREYNVRVTYTDVNGIAENQLHTPHIVATGPNNYSNSKPEIGLVITSPDQTRMTVDYRFRGPGGEWSSQNNGTYRVTLLNNGLVDVLGNPTGVSNIATFQVSLAPDTSVPTASGTFRNVTAAGTPFYNFTVRYSDDFAVDASTLGSNDVVVIRDGGGYQAAGRLLSGNDVRDSTSLGALYQVTPPGGTWDSSDNGTYRVFVLGGGVRDTGGNGVATAQVGSFTVNVPAGGPLHPYATLNPSDVRVETRILRFSVTYHDDGLIDASTIAADEFDVFIQPSSGAVGDFASAVSIHPSNNASTVTVNYEVDLVKTWTAADNGITVPVQLFGSAVSDTSGNAVPSGIIGVFKIKISDGGVDTNAPQAYIEASNVTLPGDHKQWFALTFADDTQIDVSTVTPESLYVMGPDGQETAVTIASVNYGENSPFVTASFGMEPPGGQWDTEDNGLYKVVVRAGTVSDTSGNFLPGQSGSLPPGGELTSFLVDVVTLVDPVPATASLNAGNLTLANQTHHEFQVTYAHPDGIDVSRIGDDDIIVTGPAEFAAFAEFVRLDNDTNGSPRTATYRVAAPAATWTDLDNGAYEVHAAGASLENVGAVSGTVVGPGVLGTFDVAIVSEPDLLDFGDAPTAVQSGFAGDYPVTRAQDGARHIPGSLFLGSLVDIEPDGQPADQAGYGGAGGDDHNGQSDEDGLRVVASIVASGNSDTASSILAIASEAGKLDGWIDFNQDGDWSDVGEQILASVDVAQGRNLLPFPVPAAALAGATGVRLRLSSGGGLGPRGLATDGEVEDYFLDILDGDLPGGIAASIVTWDPTTLQLLLDEDHVIARVSSTDLFRSPGASLERITIRGTDGDDTLEIADLTAAFNGQVFFLAGSGDDTLRLVASGQTLDLPAIADADFRGIETLDIRGTGSNFLYVNAQEVLALQAETGTPVIRHDSDDRVFYDSDWRIEPPEFINGEYRHVLTYPSSLATLHVVNNLPWHNPFLRFDVNRDGLVAPNDVLLVINTINADGARPLEPPTSPAAIPTNYYDTFGDNLLGPIDVLVVINYLNGAAAVGESPLIAQSLWIESSPAPTSTDSPSASGAGSPWARRQPLAAASLPRWENSLPASLPATPSPSRPQSEPSISALDEWLNESVEFREWDWWWESR